MRRAGPAPARAPALLALVALITPLLAPLSGCSSVVPPRTRVYAPLWSEEPLRIFVEANAERPRVEEALRGAGLAVARDLVSANVLLRARLGGSRRGGDCGRVRNVVFELREAGQRVAIVKARGWVGPCPDKNILRDMSEDLARMLPPRAREREPDVEAGPAPPRRRPGAPLRARASATPTPPG